MIPSDECSQFAEAEALVAQIAGQASIPIEILVDAIDSALKANALDIAKYACLY